ncbi:4Fe-4S binding protein [Acidaminobacter sp. JC074]|uniref:4Fe-4S binding protein n=1 Tax=Acidaminobacter sp. JC074 TaxID=2530199 RepID=UPI001F0D8880|nr:4Fe-4S binding protein [Acidaminobacter sp. JC074]MCH4890986.1 4Fe-4S binding protein [Acidaminobacter sp. JC074]
MKNRIIAALAFIIMIGSVLLIRLNPGLFDFSVIHNLFGPNILYREHFSRLPLYVGFIGIAITLLHGPIFCGYLCPFGSFQRFMHFLGRKIGINKKMALKLHQKLSSVKYLVLIGFVFTILTDNVMAYINLDAYHGFIRLFFGGITLIGGSYLILITLMSLILERPFCNYLCPYGASLNLIASIRTLRVTRHEDKCIHCNMCDKVCPVQIEITKSETVKDVNCLSCSKCIDVCPKEGAINKKFSPIGAMLSIGVMGLLISFYQVQEMPVIADDFELPPPAEEISQTVIEEDVTEEEIVLKESSTEDYYSNPVDFIDANLLSEKNAAALLAHQEALRIEAEKKAEEARIAKEEADRKAQEEADRLAKEEADRKAQEEAEKASAGLYNDGTYKARVNAYQPGMVVQIVIKDDVIQSVEILEHNESRSYYNFATPKVIKSILDTNGTDVDTIAGCTYTSRGVINGVNACLNQAKK